MTSFRPPKISRHRPWHSMPRLAECLLTVIALLLGSISSHAQILVNGGFESGWNNWSSSLSDGGTATFSITNNYIHNGTNALLVAVTKPGSASNSVRIVSTPFKASTNDTYILRFWANTDTLDADLGINLLGADPSYPQIPFMISTNSLAEGDEHYQEYHYAFKASGNVSIAVNFQTAAQYWLDDVEVLDLTNNDGFDVPMTYLWQWGQRKFAQTNQARIGWGGGDNEKSARLPDGSVAWIFNDSYASTLDTFYSNIRGDSSLPRNSVVHQIGTNLVWMNDEANSFFVPTNLNDNLMPLAPNGLYWIAGSVAESNKLYVLLNGLNNSPLSNICMSVATLSLPGLTLNGVVTNLTSPGTDNFGDLVRGDDSYYYIYNAAKVARVPVGQLAVDAAWRYWNGTNWVSDHTQNVAISDFSGWSITHLGTSNYVAVYKPVLSLQIYAQFAPSPMGPWGNDQVIFTVPDEGGEGIFSAYMPNICAGTGSNGVYTIDFSDNGCTESWFAKSYSDKSWYNPHFFTANLLVLSPYTLNYTNGGPESRMSIKFAADQDYGYDHVNNIYGAGVLNTTNWVNLGTGGGSSSTNVPFYSYDGGKYASSARLVYKFASEMTHTVDSESKSNNVALLESWARVNNNGWYLSLTNLDAPFTNGYSVYFYFHGSAAGYGGQNHLRAYAGATTQSPALAMRQWNLYTTVASNNGTFIQDLTPANTGTTGETPRANYLLFTNLSGGAFDLLITNGNYGGVNAIEIVANVAGSGRQPTIALLTGPTNPVLPGASATLTCTVAPSPPDGEFVSFLDSTNGLGWGTLDAGQTTFNAFNLSAGTHAIQAIYGGDANYLASTSSIASVMVNLPALVNLQSSGGQVIVTWPQGMLLQATNLTGPWSTNNGTSPYTNPPDQPRMFYRARLQ